MATLRKIVAVAALLAATVMSAPAAHADTGSSGSLAYNHTRNINSGLCLLVRGEANNNPAVQFPCGNFDDQKWQL